jgi:hypothetical protein
MSGDEVLRFVQPSCTRPMDDARALPTVMNGVQDDDDMLVATA